MGGGQVDDRLDTVDHLVIGSSLPWLLPPALGDLQTVNEIAANRTGVRGRLGGEQSVRPPISSTGRRSWSRFCGSAN